MRFLLVALAASLALLLSACGGAKKEEPAKIEKKDEHTGGHKEGDEVALSPEAVAAAKLEFAEVIARGGGGRLRVAGSVETNQQQTQQATPLVSGRVERVYVALGDRVRAGQPLAVIASPQIAQMHGKLHEAETKLALAERNLKRVEQAENRAAVLTAKAKLDEAEASLTRTRRLIEVGAGAGKDLIAAETIYKTAKAEYEFQSNIVLNKEIQEARAAVETDRVDVAHIRDEMKAFGAPVAEGEHDDHKHDTSLIALRAPVSGTVTERLVNAGAGIEAGKPLFTIANLATVWVIASVPETQVAQLRVGTPASIHAAAFGADSRAGRISYIDPQLNEDTRTAKVRVELANPGEKLKAEMFVEVEFQSGAPTKEGEEIAIPSAAIQRLGERSVVFLAEENEPGHFKVREIEAGGESNGFTRILNGLKAGERVVTKGSFTLKAQLQKGEM
ncbi:MAG: efflux RND transporter periplasmic adaptor subunit, partial [Blastocatellia bacterium]